MSDSADSTIPAQQTNLSQPSSEQIPNPFSQPTDTTAFIQSQSIQPPSAGMRQSVPLRSTVPQPRNLNHRLSMEASQQAPDDPAFDPFSEAAVFPDEFAGADVIDPAKFLLSKFQIDRLDEVLFTRFKGRLLTVQRVVEFLYKEDPHFRAQLSQLYAAFCVDSGLDLRYALQVFKSEAIEAQTSCDVLADLIMIYVIYRADTACVDVPAHVCSQLQEVLEMAFRQPRSQLMRFVHQCAQGNARSENCHLLTGDTLHDSPGELFLIKPEFCSKFVKILADCVRFYLTANLALLVNIPQLVSCLVIGDASAHDLKQQLVDGVLERLEVWLSRREKPLKKLIAAVKMLHLEDEMPGQNTLINDIIKNALHPVVSSELRAVIKQHGKPRNQIQWHEFENHLAETQARLDADPDALIESLEIWCSNKEPEVAVLPLARLTLRPGTVGNLTPGPKFQHPDPVPDYPPHPTAFPTKPEDAFDCMISCRDCPKKFPFTVSEQTFYIQKMSIPHWPARCSDCQTAKKKRFSQDVVALPIDAAPAAPAVGIDQTIDHWDEILHFDDDFDDDVLPDL